MEKKKLAFIEVAAVWFGTHAGGGFATGNQTKNFFVVGGWNSLWMPLVSILIIGLVYRAAMIKALETDTYDYRSWSKAMYKPSKVMPVIYEILYLTVAICGISASIAGGASLFESYGLPYVAGILIIGAIFFVLSIFGANLIRSASTVMTVVMAVLMILICIIGLQAHAPELALSIQQHESAPLGTSVWTLLKYAGYQSVVLAIVVAVCKPLGNSKEVNKSVLVGYVMNAGILWLSTIMLFAWKDQIAGTTLPTLTVIQSLGMSWLQIAYIVVLFLAFVSTGTTCTFACVTRFEKVAKFSKNITVVRAVLSIVIMVLCMLISTVGLDAIVLKGYGMAGILGIPFVIIPVIAINLFEKKKQASQTAVNPSMEEEM